MKRILMILMSVTVTASVFAQEFQSIPRVWKWLGNEEVIFSYLGTYQGDDAFVVNARSGKVSEGVNAPARFSVFPVRPE